MRALKALLASTGFRLGILKGHLNCMARSLSTVTSTELPKLLANTCEQTHAVNPSTTRHLVTTLPLYNDNTAHR